MKILFFIFFIFLNVFAVDTVIITKTDNKIITGNSTSCELIPYESNFVSTTSCTAPSIDMQFDSTQSFTYTYTSRLTCVEGTEYSQGVLLKKVTSSVDTLKKCTFSCHLTDDICKARSNDNNSKAINIDGECACVTPCTLPKDLNSLKVYSDFTECQNDLGYLLANFTFPSGGQPTCHGCLDSKGNWNGGLYYDGLQTDCIPPAVLKQNLLNGVSFNVCEEPNNDNNNSDELGDPNADDDGDGIPNGADADYTKCLGFSDTAQKSFHPSGTAYPLSEYVYSGLYSFLECSQKTYNADIDSIFTVPDINNPKCENIYCFIHSLSKQCLPAEDYLPDGYIYMDSITSSTACNNLMDGINYSHTIWTSPDQTNCPSSNFCFARPSDCSKFNYQDRIPAGYEFKDVSSEDACSEFIGSAYSAYIWDIPSSECMLSYCYVKPNSDGDDDGNSSSGGGDDGGINEGGSNPDVSGTIGDNNSTGGADNSSGGGTSNLDLKPLLDAANKINNNVSDLNDKASNMESSLDDINDNLKKSLTNQSTMNSSLSTMNSSLSTINSSLNGLSSKIQSNGTKLDSINSNIQSNGTKLDSINTELDNITSNTKLIGDKLEDGLFGDDPFKGVDLTDDGSSKFSDFESDISGKFKVLEEKNMFDLHSGTYNLPTYEEQFYGTTVTIFKPSMLDSAPMDEIRAFILFIFAMLGFIHTFRSI